MDNRNCLCAIYLSMFYFLSHARLPRTMLEVRGLRSSPQRNQRKATFSSNREIPIEEEFSAPQAQKDFKPEEFAEGMSLSSPIGISPIGEKFHSLRSPRALCETSFHLVAATPRCRLTVKAVQDIAIHIVCYIGYYLNLGIW